MEQIKREIDKDPYAALFGRRFGTMGMGTGLWNNHEKTLTDLCRSFFGFERSNGNTASTTARVKSQESKPSTSTSTSSVSSTQASEAPRDTLTPVFDASQSYVDTRGKDLEFDPISGRMVPKKPAVPDTSYNTLSEDHTSNVQDKKDDRVGFLSPTKGSDESREVTSSLADIDVQRREPEQHENEMVSSGDKNVLDVDPSDKLSKPQVHEVPTIAKDIAMDASSGTTSAVSQPKDENVSLQQPSANDSNLVDMQQPESLTPEAKQSTHGNSEGPKMKGFFYVDKKEPEKLKIQDSPQQSEPFLVPENEELDLLRASDICYSYGSKKLDNKSDIENKKLNGTEGAASNEDSVITIDARAVESKPESQDALGSIEENTEATKHTSLQETGTPQTTQPQVQNEDADSTKTLDQTSEPHSSMLSDSPSSATYRVLAYDPSTMEVTKANADTSLTPSDAILRPSDILPQLNNPAKFLPYFEEMQKEGYQIVSGGGDILVFKRFSDIEKIQEKPSSEVVEHTEPTATDATLEQLQEQAQLTQKSSAGTTKPKAETNAPPRKQRSAFNNAIRRMLFTGTAVAGTCYAIGVVTEYFRTGGEDGRGIDAFTVFESERRRRD